MGHHHDGHAGIFLNFAKQREDRFPRGAVEISSGLVGEENFGPVDERAGDGGTLLLSAGKFAGAVADALTEADAFERLTHSGGAVAAFDFCKAEREFDIFLQGHAR